MVEKDNALKEIEDKNPPENLEKEMIFSRLKYYFDEFTFFSLVLLFIFIWLCYISYRLFKIQYSCERGYHKWVGRGSFGCHCGLCKLTYKDYKGGKNAGI